MSIASNETSTVSPVDRDFVADYTVERDNGPMVGGDNAFKVAIFGANVSTGQGGLNFADNSIKLGNWGEVQHLAQKADRYGVDGFIPIARWQGLAGPDRPWGRQFETFTWGRGTGRGDPEHPDHRHLQRAVHQPRDGRENGDHH